MILASTWQLKILIILFLWQGGLFDEKPSGEGEGGGGHPPDHIYEDIKGKSQGWEYDSQCDSSNCQHA